MIRIEPQQQMILLDIDQVFQQAIAHHQAGRFSDAEGLYRAILQIQPHHPDANHNLGVLAVQLNQPQVGLNHFKIALNANPNQAQFWLSYIDALIQTGSLELAHQALTDARHQGLAEALLGTFAERLMPAQEEINTLVSLFSEGRYLEAVPLAQAMTVHFPQHAFGWKALGVIFRQLGRSDEALESLQKAVVLSPEDADAHNNLGAVLKELGRLDAAMVSYCRALEITPDYAEAHNNLGSALKGIGRLEAAVTSYSRALAIRPDYVMAHSNLGAVLQDLGRLEAAVDCYCRALAIRPDYVMAHSNLGAVLQALGRLVEAEESYLKALKINPEFAMAYNNLAAVQRALGRLEDAESSSRQALIFKPDYAEAHCNLGAALHDQGRLEEAEISYLRALEIKRDFAMAYNNLGNTLKDLGRMEDAVASCRSALEIDSDFAMAHSNLLLNMNYQCDQPAALLLDEARCFGDLVARQARPYTDWGNAADCGRCLRVGLVSADLRDHPVGYFIESILTALSSHAFGRLELIVYCNHFLTDAVTERIKVQCHDWRSAVGLSDEGLAQQIRDDGIDILIDLSGHTAHNRLPMFAWKPAPVQVSWLGYFATTGVAAIDYLIADSWTVPEDEEVHFTESIWRLPETRLCFTPPDVEIDVAPLPAISNGYVTFGCFNNLTKMNDAVVALWSRVLGAVPQSRLFLKSRQLSEAAVRQRVISHFAAHGIAAERLILEGGSSRADYFAAYHRVDISLDPFPFPGGTTSVEGLWMGVPVLTLAGQRFLPRQGAGLLMNASLPEWIASDAEDYLARAIAHAGDLQRLSALRNGLRQQVLDSPLFDAPRFASHFEAALRGMWVQWCNQQTNSQSE